VRRERDHGSVVAAHFLASRPPLRPYLKLSDPPLAASVRREGLSGATRRRWCGFQERLRRIAPPTRMSASRVLLRRQSRARGSGVIASVLSSISIAGNQMLSSVCPQAAARRVVKTRDDPPVCSVIGGSGKGCRRDWT
jgi:hypothetical protein